MVMSSWWGWPLYIPSHHGPISLSKTYTFAITTDNHLQIRDSATYRRRDPEQKMIVTELEKLCNFPIGRMIARPYKDVKDDECVDFGAMSFMADS